MPLARAHGKNWKVNPFVDKMWKSMKLELSNKWMGLIKQDTENRLSRNTKCGNQ